MLDQWQPQQFLSSVHEMGAEDFFSSFARTHFLLLDVENASDHLLSGLFHTSPLLRHDTPLVEELSGITAVDSHAFEALQARRRNLGGDTSLAKELLRDQSMRSRFLAPLTRRPGSGGSQTAVSVGRSLSNCVVLKHHSVSRVHASFSHSGGGRLLLTDQGSKNGSWINDQRLQGTQPVRNGDILKFGQISAVLCDAEVLWDMVHPDVTTISSPYRG